ncbi:thiosulfate sulfurtransferase/rhodanese-like domain-containing protein 3 [Thamnophis elegans]|uniref:thiosulfate sulfurtransferase/rhodanese-like domain-containing protein 3 n=1 Tax=Thamnophis elegans TaxID=35005 RepID=UPI001377AC9D|nr:thiosulfate sulfurtransferase/rhodanese-like domain-containing protein 3 [Thamnophis elegans]
MQGIGRRLGQFTFGLITQPAASRLSGCGGRKISQLTWSHHESILHRFESVAGIGRLYPSGFPKTRRQIVCHFSTAEDHNVSYQQLKDLLKSKAIRLIDVREKWEIEEYGKIPGSIDIPLAELTKALQMDPASFKEKYNQDMPSKSDHVVFSCYVGVRSKQALADAKSLGFSRVQHFPGGYKEWLERESPKKK